MGLPGRGGILTELGGSGCEKLPASARESKGTPAQAPVGMGPAVGGFEGVPSDEVLTPVSENILVSGGTFVWRDMSVGCLAPLAGWGVLSSDAPFIDGINPWWVVLSEVCGPRETGVVMLGDPAKSGERGSL